MSREMSHVEADYIDGSDATQRDHRYGAVVLRNRPHVV
jgi:hypothetical protein